MKYQRFVDRKDRHIILEKHESFMRRHHALMPSRFMVFFVLITLAVSAIVVQLTIRLAAFPAWFNGGYALDPELEATRHVTFVALMGIVALLVLTLVVAFRTMRKLHDVTFFTELMNLILARSLALNSDFCFLVDRDRTVVYFDKGTQLIFFAEQIPESEGHIFDTILGHKGLTKTQREHFEQSVLEEKPLQFSFKLDRNPSSIVYEVEVRPVPKLDGYSLVRGFVEKHA